MGAPRKRNEIGDRLTMIKQYTDYGGMIDIETGARIDPVCGTYVRYKDHLEEIEHTEATIEQTVIELQQKVVDVFNLSMDMIKLLEDGKPVHLDSFRRALQGAVYGFGPVESRIIMSGEGTIGDK